MTHKKSGPERPGDWIQKRVRLHAVLIEGSAPLHEFDNRVFVVLGVDYDAEARCNNNPFGHNILYFSVDRRLCMG